METLIPRIQTSDEEFKPQEASAPIEFARSDRLPTADAEIYSLGTQCHGQRSN
jgi:hypothetical protein